MLDRSFRGAALKWRKSSASDDKDCVEVAVAGRSVLVRDSHAPAEGMLVLDASRWRAFLGRIMDGEMDVR